MNNFDAQAAMAYLLGRAIAAEKAIQTLIASRSQPADKLGLLLQTNLAMRKTQLPMDAIPPELLPVAEQAFDEATRAVLRGVSSGKYVVPGWREPKPSRSPERPPARS